jgi:DNA-3-methyladenine glycosylase II
MLVIQSVTSRTSSRGHRPAARSPPVGLSVISPTGPRLLTPQPFAIMGRCLSAAGGTLGPMTSQPEPASGPGTAARPRGAGGVAAARPARSYRAAAALLAERDPVIARLVAEAGLARVSPPTLSHFEALVRAVVYQQLAGAAARAIHGRLVAALGQVVPEQVLATPEEALRSAGLSAAKVASVRDLATKVLDGTVVLDPAGLRAESDAEVVARLSKVRGIGKWTAEMFLMFQLRRLDVWPTGDLGVRKGFGLAWGIPTPTAKELEPLGDPYRPYRSVVAWYCWRAAELYQNAPDSALTR